MHSGNLTRVALLALLPLATGSCGFIFSHAPPEGHEQMQHFTCTESNAGPIIDIIWASLNFLGAVAAASNPEYYRDQGYEPGPIIAGGVIWGTVSSAAAGVGFQKSKKCKAAKLQLAQRQAQGQAERREQQAGDVVVQAVVISPPEVALERVGERVQLVATAYNSSGTAIPNKTFTWSSSNDAIASVNNAGLVTAHANGAVVIAAKADNNVGTANIVIGR
jgi:hypothetical protein